MNSPKRHLRLLFLMFLAVLVVQATEAANPLFAAQRLRLRVDTNTLRPGGTTKVYVEFLNREYQQVQNDRTRRIEFKYAGSGSGSATGITVYAGAQYGETTFTAGGPGKLFLAAESEGMDSGQILLVIMRPAQSFLSRLFETVAYAVAEFKIDGMIVEKGQKPEEANKVVANNKSPAIVYVSYSEQLTSAVIVRVTTSPAVKVRYGGKEAIGLIELPLDQNKAASDPIEIVSGTPGEVTIRALVLQRGDKDIAKVEFSPRVPRKIVFDCPETIKSTQRDVSISLALVDGDDVPITSNKERLIGLRSGDDSVVVRFESDSIVMPAGQQSVRALFRLESLPAGNELRLLAEEKTDTAIKMGESSIRIQSPIEKVLVSGPTQVNRGRKEVKFRIKLADRDGKTLPADWKRKVNLSVDRGRLDVSEVIIEKGQDSAEVTYYSPSTSGKFTLTAESQNLQSGGLDVNVIIPEYWLILFTLAGALMGGIARQLHKDARFENIKPHWQGENLELGLLGRLVCSIIGGLLFYCIVKLGLSQAFGLPILPATLDLGSKSAAIVLGCIGGFGGTLVLQKTADRFFGEKTVPASPQPQPQTSH
jgi:hypothetical protein